MDLHVVVGAGQAGAHAAMAMRRAGFAGRIVLVGAEAVEPYDRPPLSKDFIVAHEEPRLAYHFAPATYEEKRIELLMGTRVESVDPREGRIHTTSGAPLPFDRLILATGSRARRPAIPGAERIMVLRTLEDARAIRARLLPGMKVVCIGAGVIGLEMASSARARGCEVTVLDVAPSVMSRSIDAALARLVEDLHRRAGVRFLFSIEVERVDEAGVVLADGARLPADIVIAGVGIERNVELAVAAGIDVGRGIKVDGSGWTSAEGILAAGEVAEYFSARAGRHLLSESWQHAQDHGALVGRVAAGLAETYDPVAWFWSDQHGVNIQMAGAMIGTTTVFRGDPASESFSIFSLDDGLRVVGAVGFNAGRDIAAARRLIGDGRPVDPARLGDTAVSLRDLLRG